MLTQTQTPFPTIPESLNPQEDGKWNFREILTMEAGNPQLYATALVSVAASSILVAEEW